MRGWKRLQIFQNTKEKYYVRSVETHSNLKKMRFYEFIISSRTDDTFKVKTLFENDGSVLEMKIKAEFPSQSCDAELNLSKNSDALDYCMSEILSYLILGDQEIGSSKEN